MRKLRKKVQNIGKIIFGQNIYHDIYLEGDILRFKIKQKVDFCDFGVRIYLLAKMDEIDIVYFPCNFW